MVKSYIVEKKKSEIVECLINEGLTILWLRCIFALLICVLDERVAFIGEIFEMHRNDIAKFQISKESLNKYVRNFPVFIA